MNIKKLVIHFAVVCGCLPGLAGVGQIVVPVQSKSASNESPVRLNSIELIRAGQQESAFPLDYYQSKSAAAPLGRTVPAQKSQSNPIELAKPAEPRTRQRTAGASLPSSNAKPMKNSPNPQQAGRPARTERMTLSSLYSNQRAEVSSPVEDLPSNNPVVETDYPPIMRKSLSDKWRQATGKKQKFSVKHANRVRNPFFKSTPNPEPPVDHQTMPEQDPAPKIVIQPAKKSILPVAQPIPPTTKIMVSAEPTSPKTRVHGQPQLPSVKVATIPKNSKPTLSERTANSKVIVRKPTAPARFVDGRDYSSRKKPGNSPASIFADTSPVGKPKQLVGRIEPHPVNQRSTPQSTPINQAQHAFVDSEPISGEPLIVEATKIEPIIHRKLPHSASPQLRVPITLSGPTEMIEGEDGDFQIELRNFNQLPITDVCLTLTLPPGLTATVLDRQADVDLKKRQVRWKLPQLNEGKTEIIRYRVVGSTPGIQAQNLVASQGSFGKPIADCELATFIAHADPTRLPAANVEFKTSTQSQPQVVAQIENHELTTESATVPEKPAALEYADH